ncbi:MAG: type II toxin-antitoxin system prevent-host-death family antitoxin [Armatimonadota bacterium]|nr:type II toxin-antitoxin system prevent-host-death family antitoxin [Armatimonadota bacterium]
MRTVNVHQAKTHLSRLLDDVSTGEEIVLAKAGRPVARLSPIQGASRRRLGALRGRFTVPADFDAPLPEWALAAFEGRR